MEHNSKHNSEIRQDADTGPAEQQAAAREKSILSTRLLIWSAVGLIAAIVFVHVFAGLLLAFVENIQRPESPGSAAVAAPTQLPPSPRLLVSPPQDLQTLRATEQARLQTYGWVNREAGVVRIPIGRAMEILAEQGLPASPDPTPEPTAPAENPQSDESGFLDIAPVSFTIPENQPVPPPGSLPGSLPGRSSQVPIDKIAYDQKLNAQVSPDLVFQDEMGNQRRLGEFFGKKPLILFFAYYDCPMLCNLVINNLAGTIRGMKLNLGDQFEVVTVSMDPRETPQLASEKKAALIGEHNWPEMEKGWHFLTGGQESIDRLADTVGFHYVYDINIDQYAHPTGIVLLTPQGRISRYLLGIEFTSRELRLGIVEASSGKIGTPVDQFFLLCYHYDPIKGRYTLMIEKILTLAGLATVTGLGGLVAFYVSRERRSAGGLSRPGVPPVKSNPGEMVQQK